MSDVRDERNGTVQVVRNLAFVDVICEGIRDKIVLEIIHVVFGGWFGSGARIPTDAKYRRRTSDEFQKGCNPDLSGRSITSRIRNMSCLS